MKVLFCGVSSPACARVAFGVGLDHGVSIILHGQLEVNKEIVESKIVQK